MPNQSDTKKITFIVDMDMYQQIADIAAKKKRSMNKQVLQMVEYYLNAGIDE